MTWSALHAPPMAGASARLASAPRWLLPLGGALVVLTFMRFGVAELGWIVFAPFLAYIQGRSTWRAHLALLAALVISFLLAVSKIATAEIPWAPVPAFALPIALSYFFALASAGAAHRSLGVRRGIYTFAAMVVVLGWAQYAFSPGASWGVLAHTQIDNLPLIQLVALTGLGGMTFVVALGSALAAAVWSHGARRFRADLVVFASMLGAALLYGQWRLASPADAMSLRVGGVVSPVTHDDFHAAATAGVKVLHGRNDELFARSLRAAELGARVIVWNEVATITDKGGEGDLVSRGQSLAQERGVVLLMAYGVIESMQPLFYTNKYRLYMPDGRLADEYVKRHPVPVDPNPKGAAHAKVVAFEGARITGAICYDYSFPGIAWDNASDGASLALVPASDWRGIDPEHGRMALVNAVAVGLPMMRPVRAATSIASDSYGRLLGSLRADGPGQGVMVVDMPVARVPTLYARTGEVVPLVALGYVVLVLFAGLRSVLKSRGVP
jgi:apolipoprotein N-acyltransferase